MRRALATTALGVLLVLAGVFALGRFAPTAPTRGLPAVARAPSRSPSALPTSSRTITLTFTEQDLTDAARQYTPMTVSGITVTDPVIRLQPGRLTLTATGHAFVLSGQIVVVASPVVTDGKAGANIESATFAGVGLPDSTKQSIADTFARTLAANIPAGVRVTRVTVGSGSLVVEALPA